MTDSPQRHNNSEPWFVVPTRSHLFDSLKAAILISALFAVVYGGADYVSGLRKDRLRIDLPFEKHVPFIPELSPLYSSLYAMFAAVPFVLHRRRLLWLYVLMMTLITCIAGAGFLLIPAELTYAVPTNAELLPAAFRVADWLNLTYNLCPSLHVAYAAFHAVILCQQKTILRWPFHSWAVAIALAAWLTHQHHLIDLIAGYILGFLAGVCFSTPGGTATIDEVRHHA